MYLENKIEYHINRGDQEVAVIVETEKIHTMSKAIINAKLHYRMAIGFLETLYQNTLKTHGGIDAKPLKEKLDQLKYTVSTIK